MSPADQLGVPVVEAKLDTIRIAEVVAGTLFKAVTDDGDGGQQEALFTVIGVLGRKEFPPVTWREAQAQPATKLAQSLVLHGCKTVQFDCMEQFVSEIHWMASQSVVNHEVYLLDPLTTHQSLGLTVGLNTRYFTRSRTEIPDEVKVSFSDLIDPKGVLASLRTENLDHCFDNAVQYLQYADNQFATANPGTFKPYDLVQASFAINVFRTYTDGAPKFAVKLVLRAVSLLDSTFSKERQLDMYKSSLKRQNNLDGTASERKWKHIRLNANPLAGRVFETRVQPRKQAKAKAVAKPSSATNGTASSAAKVGSGTGNAAQKKKAPSASMDVDGKS
ncbi:hypothetical protein C8F01DRAFT_1258876 [Mycena amicta]|nr:hypothetical protein C8F01DRAFT_1268241 [Mycena amicta]KAJ7055261.1 hypothetical protein C8F01DRAFT_1258876 [Mycena amicta]